MTRPIRPAPARVRALASAAALALAASACFLAGTPPSAPSPQGIAPLEAQVTAHPADVDAALRLAGAYRAANRMDDARVLLERTVANAPRNDAAVLLLGLAYEDLGRFADARALYERGAATASTSAARRRFRGRLEVVRRLELVAATKNALARETALAQTPPRSNTVAIFPFAFAAGDSTLRPLGRALAEMLATDLAQTDRLTVLERARVQALLDEAALGASALAEPSTAVRSGRLLGADRVVQGRIAGDAGSVRLDAQLMHLGSAGVLAPVSRQAAAARVLDAEKELALELYAQMEVQLTAAERERVNRRPTESLQALLAFGIGLERADAGDFAGAAAGFRRAAALDPSFAAARERAAAAEVAAGAASTTTAQLAAAVAQEIAVPQLGGLGIEDVANLPLARDPASEGLGGEQMGRARTGIEIVIHRP